MSYKMLRDFFVYINVLVYNLTKNILYADNATATTLSWLNRL